MRPRKPDKPREAASNAVRALRNALGMTQQQFAVDVVKTAIGTVAVWETTRPPRGETLLKLAEIAWQHEQGKLSTEFEKLFLDEVVPRLRTSEVYRRREDGSGYMLFFFPDQEHAAAGPELLRTWAKRLEGYRGPVLVVDPDAL